MEKPLKTGGESHINNALCLLSKKGMVGADGEPVSCFRGSGVGRGCS